MDLSHWGQSRDAEGRHRAARPGLGPWVGARVASPRCPILRPGPYSGSGTTATGQRRGWVSRAQARADALLELWTRIRRSVPCPHPEEEGRGGVGLGVCHYRIIRQGDFYHKEDDPRRDCEHLRPPNCPVTFLTSASRPCGERPAKYRGTRTAVIGTISHTANSAVVRWAQDARGSRALIPRKRVEVEAVWGWACVSSES
jgi:hypothetical protein